MRGPEPSSPPRLRKAEGLSSTAIQAIWDAPEKANGPIARYRVYFRLALS